MRGPLFTAKSFLTLQVDDSIEALYNASKAITDCLVNSTSASEAAILVLANELLSLTDYLSQGILYATGLLTLLSLSTVQSQYASTKEYVCCSLPNAAASVYLWSVVAGWVLICTVLLGMLLLGGLDRLPEAVTCCRRCRWCECCACCSCSCPRPWRPWRRRRMRQQGGGIEDCTAAPDLQKVER